MSKVILKNRIFDSAEKPIIMGILNITPDSFSDGNLFYQRESALKRAAEMVLEGADILDVGGESSRPGADPVSLQQEIDRVLPVVELLKKEFDTPVSVDTYKAGVAAACASAGADMLNDITGLAHDAALARIAAEHQMGICVMHMRGTPQTMQSQTDYTDLIGDIKSVLFKAAKICRQAGIPAESIVLDPGIGFAKDANGNLTILKRLAEFKESGYPLLIGTSRKSFIGKLLNCEVHDRLYGTIASNVTALINGADIFRVHDVKAHRQALDLTMAVINSK